MSDFFDIYIIKNTRKKAEITAFNKRFLGTYKETASEYEIPQYSENPEKVFAKADELLSYCETNANVSHVVYWKSTVNGLYSEIFYTKDGFTVFGLSTEDETKCDSLFQEMAGFLGCDFGYITAETPAPDYFEKFTECLLSELKHDKKYADLLPGNKFNKERLLKIKRSDIENDRKLCYGLLTWCRDINWPVAKEIVKMLKKPNDLILSCINEILKFNDEDWNFCLTDFILKEKPV